MQVARPSDGFKVVVRPEVTRYIEAEIQNNFRLRQFWNDILARIKLTALQEGTLLPSAGMPTFSFVANGAVDFNIPTVQLIFECFADTLTVTSALVWNEQDYEDSSY